MQGPVARERGTRSAGRSFVSRRIRVKRPLGKWMSAALAALAVWAPTVARAQDAAAYFKQNCVSCHTIGGGRLTGPDLKDVTARRDHAWLLRYMPNPKAMIDGGDPAAVQLFQEARGVLMPSLPGMTPSMVDAHHLAHRGRVEAREVAVRRACRSATVPSRRRTSRAAGPSCAATWRRSPARAGVPLLPHRAGLGRTRRRPARPRPHEGVRAAAGTQGPGGLALGASDLRRCRRSSATRRSMPRRSCRWSPTSKTPRDRAARRQRVGRSPSCCSASAAPLALLFGMDRAWRKRFRAVRGRSSRSRLRTRPGPRRHADEERRDHLDQGRDRARACASGRSSIGTAGSTTRSSAARTA